MYNIKKKRESIYRNISNEEVKKEEGKEDEGKFKTLLLNNNELEKTKKKKYNHIVKHKVNNENCNNSRNIIDGIDFPIKDNINYYNLILNYKGKYSFTQHYDSLETISIIKRHLKKPINELVITDVTAGNGGDTIQFCIFMKKVNSIEYNKEMFDILSNNVNTYKLNNVNLIHGNSYNYLSIGEESIKLLKQDVVYIDAPWGGLNYKKYKSLNLYLNNIPLYDIFNTIYDLSEKNSTKLVIFKVPFNFNIQLFFNRIKSTIYTMYKVYNYHIVVVNIWKVK